MENKRQNEDVTVDVEGYITQREQRYSEELAEARYHLAERIKEVKTDLEKDIREVKMDLKDDIKELKNDLKEDINDLKDDIKGIKTQVMGLMALGVTSLIALIGIIVTLLLQR